LRSRADGARPGALDHLAPPGMFERDKRVGVTDTGHTVHEPRLWLIG
jgi:hypothetical protein